MQSNNTLIPFLHTLFFTNILSLNGLFLVYLSIIFSIYYNEVVSGMIYVNIGRLLNYRGVNSLHASGFFMNYKLTKQLKNHPKYFIHVGGFVFKVISPNKDIIIDNEYDENSKSIYVIIDGERKNLLYLMIENFLPHVKQNQQFKFSISEGNKMPLSGIKITDFVSEISNLHEETILKYGCKQRADSANQRSRHLITPVHVAECLINNDFLCYYCKDELNIMNWHLDHFIPLSKNGVNRFDNLVPACSVCNIMKGALQPYIFQKQCYKIISNFQFVK